MGRGLFLAILSGLLWVSAACAQTQTALIADMVEYDLDGDRLVATGNVEILYDGQVLVANKVTYDNITGNVIAEGPLRIADPGNATLVAEVAELTPDTQTALVQGARLVLAQSFEFAALEASSNEANDLQLYRTVGSSCKVCAQSPVPLWLVRADRIVRNAENERIYVRNAFFDVGGVTVAYFPYFSFPDPDVGRATGLLRPEFRNSDLFGPGVRLPYFVVINDHSDISITPFLTSLGANIVEGEYRQVFRGGRVTVNGAIGQERLRGQPQTRGFVKLAGRHQLPYGFRLNVDLAWASDNGFMSTYGYDTTDRLDSTISVSRQRATQRTEISLAAFRSLRTGDDQRTIPFVLPEFSHRRYWDDDFFGGRIDLSASGSTIIRLTGRDVSKVLAGGEWSRREILPGGVVARVFGRGDAAIYWTADDPAVTKNPLFVSAPSIGAEIRWPLAHRSETSTRIFEPVAQVIYTDLGGDWASVPNEDSQLTEFDAANLFSLNRFPGSDRRDDGLRLNLGGSFQWLADGGRQATLTLGQVFRSDPTSGFGIGTGLNGLTSNIVAAAIVDLPPNLRLSNQTLFDEKLDFFRNDVQARVTYKDATMSASYVYFDPDPSSGLTQRHEFSLNGGYQMAPNWRLAANWRRDLQTGRNVTAGAGLEFANECVKAEISASRRFTKSSNVPSSTEYGFAIGFVGLGIAPDDAGPRSACIQ